MNESAQNPGSFGTRAGFADKLAQASVLIVDDEPGMRNFLYKVLTGNCARVDIAEDARRASQLLDENTYDIIILDNIMPDKTGLEWLAEQRLVGLFSDAILITAHADLDTAIQAIRAGAIDLLPKPFRSNQILNAISHSLERVRLRRQNSVLRHELELGKDILKNRDALLGSSAEIELVRQSVLSAAKTNAPVVIRGEVGSGKQVAARMLHASSRRADHPFVWLQCHGMAEDAFRECLFGRLETQPDGTVTRHDGILQSAAGGTLYLEDIDALSPGGQNVLTELLGTGRFSPLRASRSVELDMRIVSSTTRPLSVMTREKAFRPELFYLLTVIEIIQPPLRERYEDILDIVRYFSDALALRMGVDVPEFTPLARRRFMSHTWPGNVMELRNTIERALIRGSFEDALEPAAGEFETESLAAVEQRHILAMLDACGGNRAAAARRLGVARKTIDRKCRAWGL
ncbi:MAG: sigma-54-dependent Fis family transcriptional regulator [Rhodobacteraceae bacterium]|nr:sigma-54-dependent Fis family transcriptional regulator [Paracoccaceae bacterium]